MSNSSGPYALPQSLESDLSPVFTAWKTLRRGEAEMPFADDFNRLTIDTRTGNVVLFEVFEPPVRMRFNMLGAALAQRLNRSLTGEFLDDVGSGFPFQYLASQASATVEGRRPTYYRHESVGAAAPYARLLLPMWADGHVAAVIAAFAFD